MGWGVGGRLKREGTYVHLQLILNGTNQHSTVKAIILQIKQKKRKKNTSTSVLEVGLHQWKWARRNEPSEN